MVVRLMEGAEVRVVSLGVLARSEKVQKSGLRYVQGRGDTSRGTSYDYPRDAIIIGMT